MAIGAQEKKYQQLDKLKRESAYLIQLNSNFRVPKKFGITAPVYGNSGLS